MKKIITPTREELFEAFNKIKNSTHEGINGVFKFDSGNPGPVLGVTIQTHGNEPSGLATLWYFLNVEPIENLLKNGAVFFVINNIKATEKYFSAKNDDERRLARFVEVNFNRLPKDVMARKVENNYEVGRAQELKNIWSKFDVGMDIHSTTQESEPMIIAINKFEKDLVKGFPISIVISNIENIQIGVPPTIFYGGDKNISILAIESGSHEKQSSFVTAITCMLNLMQNIKMTSEEVSIEQKQEYLLYEVVGSLVFPNSSYVLSKIYPMFGNITKGEILANGDNGPLHAPLSGCTIFGPKQEKPDSIAEEVLFFTKPVKKLLV